MRFDRNQIEKNCSETTVHFTQFYTGVFFFNQGEGGYLMFVLVKQMKNSLPSETVVSMKTSIPKIGVCYSFLGICFGTVQGK